MRYFLILLVISLNLFVKAYGQDNQTLSLKKALDIALENNHHIKSATATLPLSEAKLIIAKYRPNPTIGSYNEIVKGGSLHPAELSTEIEVGRKRHWRIELAKEEISKTELEIRKVVWEIHTQVHAAYSALAVQKELFTLAKEREEFYRTLLDIAEKRFSAGDISALDLLRAKTELLKAENNLSQIDGSLRQAIVDFNHLLGRDPQTEVTLQAAESLKPKITLHDHPKIKEIVGDALENSFDIAILEKRFGIAKAKIKKASWERIPNFQIEAGPTKPSLGDNIWGPYFGGGFEIPIFDRKQGEIKSAKAELEYLKREEERIKHDIAVNIANAFENLEVQEEQIHRFKDKLLEEAQTVLDMVKAGFEKGKLSFSDALVAEEENREINEQYLQGIQNYQLALANLEYVVGVPLLEFGEDL